MKFPPFIAAGFALLLLTSPKLAAATWFVDDDIASPGVGTSWGTAFDNLQDALEAASANDMILVAKGVYYPDEGGSEVDGDRNATFQLIDDVQIFGGFPNGGGMSRNLANNRTFLSGDIDKNDVDAPTGGNSHNVVTGTGTASTAVLDGFVITAGLADVTTDPAFSSTNSGAGMLNLSGSPVIRNCVFMNNSATFGGGIFNFNSSSPDLTNCLFFGNYALGFGGGINNRSSSSPTLINCTFTGNEADSSSGGGGGAITNFGACNPSLTNCILWNNSAEGDTTVAAASVNDSGGSSTTSFAYCLIENINPGGTSLDGTLAANDPEFLFPGDPTAAPSKIGDFRLEEGSPALDFGDNTANTENKDLLSNPRIADTTIDLGAYEGGFPSVLLDTLFVDHMVGTPVDGSSWALAFATLQDALDSAVTGQTILVAGGTYYPDEGGSSTDGDRSASYRLVTGVRVEGGYPNGGGARDIGANPTILSGDIDKNDSGSPVGDNSYTVVIGSNSDASAILDGFVIAGGLANSGSGDFDEPQNAGGAMHIKVGSPTLQNCVFRGNFAQSGGGVLVTGESTPTFINCVVSGNVTTSFGGGFHNRQSSSPNFINTTFSGNTASSSGGAMNNFGADPTFTNCIVWNNMAQGVTTSEGASINSSGSSDTTFEYCLVQNQALTGTNFDGTVGGNDPFFVLPIDPTVVASTSGDLRLFAGSVALDAGDMSANSQVVDVSGGLRVIGAGIDLGAYEGAVMNPDSDGDGLSDSFELAHTAPPSSTSLDPDSNDDMDPFTALEEFAFGLDPNVGNGIADAYSVAIVEDAMMNYLSISWSISPAAIAFVDILPEQSFDLGISDAWSNGDTVSISAHAGMGAARSSSAVNNQAKDFLRLRVTKKSEIVGDEDGDGLSDSFELAHTAPPSSTSLAAGSNEDNDPFTALEEFAFGLDPNVGNGIADAYSFAIVEDAMMDYLSISWSINPAAISFVDILPEQSFDLGGSDAWSNSDTVPISAPAGMGAARSSSAVSSQAVDFLRVRVEKK